MKRGIGVVVVGLELLAAGSWGCSPRSGGGPAPGSTGAADRVAIPVYFVAADGSGLSAETRHIDRSPDLAEGIRRALAELLAGPRDPRLRRAVPAGTRLRGVYVDKRQHAYCDFSHEIRDEHPGGSASELWTVFSIVNTLTTDFPSVRKVQFLIDGSPAATLAGHLDINRPLSKRLLLISKLSGQ